MDSNMPRCDSVKVLTNSSFASTPHAWYPAYIGKRQWEVAVGGDGESGYVSARMVWEKVGRVEKSRVE
jgi:hypothetical protein